MVKFVTKILAVALISLCTLEIGVRCLGLAPPLANQFGFFTADPWLPFKPQPGSQLDGGSLSAEFTFHYSHNSLGFRDREHKAEKPPGTFRIVALGDSFTYGVGTSQDATYPALLEQKLNRRMPRRETVEVINAGVPRYFPELERLMLEHYAIGLKPDLILIGFVANDLVETQLGSDAVRIDPDSGYLLSREARALGRAGIIAYRYSHLVRALWRVLVTDKLWSGPHLGWLPERSTRESLWREIAAEYSKIKAIAPGAALAVVNIPMKSLSRQESDEIRDHLRAWCQANDAQFIDSTAALRSEPPGQPLYWEIDQHCTPAGYDILASVVADCLSGADGIGTSRGECPGT